jgi:hypothetical protein
VAPNAGSRNSVNRRRDEVRGLIEDRRLVRRGGYDPHFSNHLEG